jgi:predicted histidine transporter YuiF (NhaC family)
MNQLALFKWLIIFAIVIIANMLFNYSLSFIFDEPVFEEVCPQENLVRESNTKEACDLAGGEWIIQEVAEFDREIGYCNQYSKCNEKFEDLRSNYEQKVFFILVFIGIIILALGMFVKVPTLSTALSLTAFIDFVFASIRYWEYSDDLMRIGILFVALLVLVFITITKYRNLQKDGKIQP